MTATGSVRLSTHMLARLLLTLGTALWLEVVADEASVDYESKLLKEAASGHNWSLKGGKG